MLDRLLNTFTFLIVNIKQGLTWTILYAYVIFTFLIVNIKPDLDENEQMNAILFTFLIVNIKRKLADDKVNVQRDLHSS